MVPEFDVKKVNSKISHDILANIFTLMLVAAVGFYFILDRGFHGSDGAKFGLIIFIVLLQVVSHFIPKVKDWEFLNSGGAGALLIYNVAVGLLFLWFIPLYSPFILILPAVMFITIYYRGVTGFLIGLLALFTIVTAVTLRNGVPAVDFGHYYPYITILLGIAYAGIIQRVGSINNEVRSEFQRISNRVDLDREQLNSLINNLTEAVLAVDREGIVLFHNQAATQLLGTESTLTGKQLTTFLQLYNAEDQIIDILSLAKKQSKDIQPENLHLLTEHKEKLSLYIDVAPINSNYQQAQQGFIILLRDITKEKTLEQQRDEFIAVTADELRNPIAIAEGNVSVILSTTATRQLDPTTQQRLQQTHDSIIFLGELVNQLDLLHRAETSALQLEIDTINPVDLLQKLVDSFSQEAAKKNLQLLVNVDPNLAKIKSSTEYVREILQKYVSNAIKYTTAGSIHVRATNGDGGTVRFSVSDTGVGIGQSDKSKLFHKFYRSEDYHTRQTRGTGLGLYIVLKIATQLQAKVWFESEINKGSTFYVQVPSFKVSSSTSDKH